MMYMLNRMLTICDRNLFKKYFYD